MRFPRLRIRTLMIAVALVAVVCVIGGQAIESLLILLLGPLIGAFWVGHRSGGNLRGFFKGSVLGALPVPVILWVIAFVAWVFLAPGDRITHDDEFAVVILMVVPIIGSMVLACVVAPIAWFIYLQNEPWPAVLKSPGR